jgi:hypothetical protein
MRVAVQEYAEKAFRIGLDESGALTLYVIAELLPDDALAELGRELEPVQVQRAWA